MSEEAIEGLTPRDRDVEVAQRLRRTRSRIAIGVIAALVAVIGVGQLTFGWVSRVIDATGWTCGGGWTRIDGDELTDMRIIGWGTPEVREQGVDPEEFADLPPGLAEPSLTTPGIVESDIYDPLLYPLDGGVVLQADGYYDHTWVGVDARSGGPLWGIAHDASGFGTLQGRFALVASREDGRTDLTTFDPRTGEKLSCVRLEGSVIDMTAVGESDIAVVIRTGDDEDTLTSLLRIDPVTGEEVWDRPLGHGAATLVSDGQVIAVSSSGVGSIATRWSDDNEATVVTVDAADGHETGQMAPGEGQWSAVDPLTLPDGSSATLLYGFADREAWSDQEAEYVLVDAAGEELWRVSTPKEQESLHAWTSGGVVVVLDGSQLAGIDLTSGERLWRADEVSTTLEDVAVLAVDGVESMIVADQRIADDEETAFVTLAIDPATGETITYEAALRDATLTDSYLLTSSGMTQIVIPLAQ